MISGTLGFPKTCPGSVWTPQFSAVECRIFADSLQEESLRLAVAVSEKAWFYMIITGVEFLKPVCLDSDLVSLQLST